MMNLPRDVCILSGLLEKRRQDLDKAKKAYEYFIIMQKSEFYDKYVAAPVEEAKNLGQTKEQLEEMKKNGLVKFEIEFNKSKKKKESELKLNEYKKDIKRIKQQMLEIDPNSINEISRTPARIPVSAQNKFEASF